MGDANSLVAVRKTTKEKGKTMVVALVKCQICGRHFEVEMLDQADPNERDRHGTQIRCPNCQSAEIEIVRPLRRARPAR